jgi:hypothetical protein
VPLSSFNDDDRQFLIYRVGYNDIYIVTNRGGLTKTGLLEISKLKLKFKILEVRLIYKQFLIFTELISKSTATIDNLMNYYTIARLGAELKIADINLLRLTPGKFLCNYYNPENDSLMIDFVLPDNDNIKGDEIPITTFFYSKSARIFEVYVEEMQANSLTQIYDHTTYRRHITNQFIF